MINTLVTFISIFACTRAAKWYLGMNMNPCDGSNLGYGGPWADNSDVGTAQQALTHDFMNNSVWNMPVGYITIARHHNAICEMSKTWELTDKSKSLYDYFSNYPGRIYATGDGSQSDTHIQADMPTTFEGQNTDPIFGADGGLVFNWWYSNNGARIANPGGYKVQYSLPGEGENNDDLHGLGCEFGANTQNGEGSAEWWHDAAQLRDESLSGDCHGGSCLMVGTDHGTSLNDGPCTWGNYAIYVSKSAETFACQGETLASTVSTAVDCQFSWGDFSSCSKVCGEGTMTRTATVTVEAARGGAACPDPLSETETCNEHDCCPNGIGTFNWDEMTGQDMTMVPDMNVITFDVDTQDLTLTIRVELEYLGKTSAHNQRQANFGTTYVLDFEDFNAHYDNIFQPGTCQNRKEFSFTNVDFNDMWTYSNEPQNAGGINSANTLAYPPSDWTLFMEQVHTNGCDTIVYERTFTWQELRECTAYGGAIDDRFNTVEEDINDNLKLSGVFYINVVSPFSNNGDEGYYRVYQLLSQPFSITVSKSLSVLGSTGINLFTMWVIAVYKEDQEANFRLVVMTESAEYLTLTRNDFFEFEKDDSNKNNIDSSIFTAPTAPSAGCLDYRKYICTQLWNIEANGQGCEVDVKGTDFSGTYSLGFKPECKAGEDFAHCEDFLAQHEDIKNNLVLPAYLKWKDEICDPLTWELQFLADMLFYKSNGFVDGQDIATVDASHLFRAGVDTIYVEIDTRFPDDTIDIFNTVLTNVWICTFKPSVTPITFDDVVHNDNIQLNEMGCFSNEKDDFIVDSIFFEKDVVEVAQDIVDFQLYTEFETDIVQFSFLIPEEVARDTLYIHAQIEVELTEAPGQPRRRMLLDVNTANQISHFGNEIGITHNNNKKPIIPNEPIIPNPSSTVYLSLKSSWVIAIGCLLIFVLTLNICFMCYANRHSLCKRRRKGYESVKHIDSEFDSEAQMLDNQ